MSAHSYYVDSYFSAQFVFFCALLGGFYVAVRLWNIMQNANKHTQRGVQY